jgi:hypothetical protein
MEHNGGTRRKFFSQNQSYKQQLFRLPPRSVPGRSREILQAPLAMGELAGDT